MIPNGLRPPFGANGVQALAAGDQLRLRRDPRNGYDRRAVSVWTADGRMLGYVPRIHNQAVANLVDAGIAPEARVGTIGGPAAMPDIGVETIQLAVEHRSALDVRKCFLEETLVTVVIGTA